LNDWRRRVRSTRPPVGVVCPSLVGGVAWVRVERVDDGVAVRVQHSNVFDGPVPYRLWPGVAGQQGRQFPVLVEAVWRCISGGGRRPAGRWPGCLACLQGLEPISFASLEEGLRPPGGLAVWRPGVGINRMLAGTGSLSAMFFGVGQVLQAVPTFGRDSGSPPNESRGRGGDRMNDVFEVVDVRLPGFDQPSGLSNPPGQPAVAPALARRPKRENSCKTSTARQ